MSSHGRVFSRRAGLIGGVVAAALLCTGALGAPLASAETLTAECKDLQAQINAAVKTSDAKVVLSEMCTGSQAEVTLPEGAGLTLEGASGRSDGLDGSTVTKFLIEGKKLGAITLANLTIEDANGGGGIKLNARAVTLANDFFAGDTGEGPYVFGGGADLEILPQNGACEAGEPPGLTVTGSSFIGDTAKATSTGPARGGGLYAVFSCPARLETLSRDTFERDSVVVSDSSEAEGGGASFSAGSHEPMELRQEGDVFASDTVTGPAEGNRGGGGEWLEGINMTSVGDRFSQDSIPGTTGPSWSWGAGLGILNTDCTKEIVDASTLEDAVVVGNSIGEGAPADLGGAGIYVGVACGPDAGIPSHLRLLDSTVTENSVETAGATSGIDGHSTDELELENSIVAANPGGAQLRGFTTAPGSLTSLFSDACNEAGTSPLPGEGNICAPPRLADEGDPSSLDLQETEASPTIDAGSNALVPGGLALDYIGFSRILASVKPIGCYSEPPVGPPTVDMGATEYTGAVTRGPAPPCAPRVSNFTFPKITQLPRGALKLTFTGVAPGKLTVGAKLTVTRLLTVKLHGRRVHRRRSETVVLAHGALTVAKAGTVSITLTPSKHARALLAAHRREAVRLTITYAATGALATTRTKSFTDVYKLPRHSRHRA